MDEKSNIKTEVIKTTEDKVRLALKERKEYESSSARLFTFFGFLVSFLVPLFTSTFKDVGYFKANIITAIFIVLSVIFAILIVFEFIKILRNRIKCQGDDDWFVYRIQDKKKPKKVKPDKLSSSWDWDWGTILNVVVKLILWILPLVLWVLVMFLIGWGKAWSVYGENPNWIPTLIFSLLWFAATYGLMFLYLKDINDFIDDRIY